jgi:hypothetical protein
MFASIQILTIRENIKYIVIPNLESSAALQMRLLAKSLNITVPCPLASK